jgi:hypothetical protein
LRASVAIQVPRQLPSMMITTPIPGTKLSSKLRGNLNGSAFTRTRRALGHFAIRMCALTQCQRLPVVMSLSGTVPAARTRGRPPCQTVPPTPLLAAPSQLAALDS